MEKINPNIVYGLMEAYYGIYSNEDTEDNLELENIFCEWVQNLLDEGYDLSETTWDDLYEYCVQEIEEQNLFEDLVLFCYERNIFDTIEESEEYVNTLLDDELVEVFVENFQSEIFEHYQIDLNVLNEASPTSLSKLPSLVGKAGSAINKISKFSRPNMSRLIPRIKPPSLPKMPSSPSGPGRRTTPNTPKAPPHRRTDPAPASPPTPGKPAPAPAPAKPSTPTPARPALPPGRPAPGPSAPPAKPAPARPALPPGRPAPGPSAPPVPAKPAPGKPPAPAPAKPAPAPAKPAVAPGKSAPTLPAAAVPKGKGNRPPVLVPPPIPSGSGDKNKNKPPMVPPPMLPKPVAAVAKTAPKKAEALVGSATRPGGLNVSDPDVQKHARVVNQKGGMALSSGEKGYLAFKTDVKTGKKQMVLKQGPAIGANDQFIGKAARALGLTKKKDAALLAANQAAARKNRQTYLGGGRESDTGFKQDLTGPNTAAYMPKGAKLYGLPTGKKVK